jgi:HPt (histidine-containing phosphotransfer) domain-containing protein
MSGEIMRNFGARPRAASRAELKARNASRDSRDRAIDLVHLARQSLGDRALEIELLTLFEHQAGHIIDQLKAAPASSDRRSRHDLAHTLKGSARAVGAVPVAAAAQAYEDALYSGAPEPETTRARDALAAAVEEARGAVRELVRER